MFGTDANLRVCWVPYSGPLSNGLSTVLGSSSDALAVAADMQAAKKQPVDLIVWSESSQVAAATLLKALRYPGTRDGLQAVASTFRGRCPGRVHGEVRGCGGHRGLRFTFISSDLLFFFHVQPLTVQAWLPLLAAVIFLTACAFLGIETLRCPGRHHCQPQKGCHAPLRHAFQNTAKPWKYGPTYTRLWEILTGQPGIGGVGLRG